MSSSKGNGAELEPDQPMHSQASARADDSVGSVPTTPGALFLMVNSLETGGTERQFVQIAQSLRKEGRQVDLGCLQKKGPFLEGLGDLHVSELGGSLYGYRSIRSRWELVRYLRNRNIAVAHSFDFYANLMLIPAAKMAGVPVIGSLRQLGDLLTPAQFRVQSTMFRWCDRVVCNSHAAADRLRQAGLSENKLVVVGNGLPPEVFAETSPAMPRAEGTLRVAMISRMNAAYKNHRTFLRAAALLVRRFSKVEFVLVGDGPLRPELERDANALGVLAQVHFLGDRRDIAAILAGSDISVVPSASESLSNVVLESMAAGVAVVASAVGGNCELGAGGRALLVAPNDEEALAAGLQQVLENPELRLNIAGKARRFARENFSIDHVRQQYSDLYTDVIADKKDTASASRRQVRKSPGSRIRVVFVAPSLRYVGGQAVQADLLMRSWKDDPDVRASFVPVDPGFPRALAWVERVPLLRTMVREPKYIYDLWKNLKHSDVVHIFSASYSSFLLAPLPAWVVSRQRGKKMLINYRSGECRDHLQRSSIAREVLKHTDELVVPSRYLVDVLAEFGLKARAIPNIVDASQFSFRPRRPLRPHLVCTRGFHTYYCVDVVVRAFAEVQKISPDAHLDLVGGGPLEGEIRNLVQDLKLTGVNFKGVAARNEIGRFYDDADIFINASRLDNMPVSVLEAFASGMPVVTTEPESMRYLVEHGRTGLLSPVGDALALAQNVIRLLQNPELADLLVSNARQEFERYSWPVVREQWLEVYRGLAHGERKTANELAAAEQDSMNSRPL